MDLGVSEAAARGESEGMSMRVVGGLSWSGMRRGG